MSKVLPRFASLAAAAYMALILTGCSSTTSGDPTSQAGAPSASTTKQDSTSASASASPGEALQELKQIDPCDLLNPSERKALGISKPGKEDDTKDSRGCQWRAQTNQDHASILTSIRDHQGINTVKTPKESTPVKSIKINGRAAKQQTVNATCLVAVSVTKTSRVDITTSLDDASKSCAAAQQVAKVVEKHLPGK